METLSHPCGMTSRLLCGIAARQVRGTAVRATTDDTIVLCVEQRDFQQVAKLLPAKVATRLASVIKYRKGTVLRDADIHIFKDMSDTHLLALAEGARV